MTPEEIIEAEELYEARLANTKQMRAEIDLNFQKVVFGQNIQIKTLGDIIFHAINERQETYFENGEIQTPGGKRRTIEDTYRIQKSYNLKCAFKDVKNAIEQLELNDHLSVVFCKKTLVRTYSRVDYNHTVNQFNTFMDTNNLNHLVKPILIKKKLLKKKAYAI